MKTVFEWYRGQWKYYIIMGVIGIVVIVLSSVTTETFTPEEELLLQDMQAFYSMERKGNLRRITQEFELDRKTASRIHERIPIQSLTILECTIDDKGRYNTDGKSIDIACQTIRNDVAYIEILSITAFYPSIMETKERNFRITNLKLDRKKLSPD